MIEDTIESNLNSDMPKVDQRKNKATKVTWPINIFDNICLYAYLLADQCFFSANNRVDCKIEENESEKISGNVITNIFPEFS